MIVRSTLTQHGCAASLFVADNVHCVGRWCGPCCKQESWECPCTCFHVDAGCCFWVAGVPGWDFVSQSSRVTVLSLISGCTMVHSSLQFGRTPMLPCLLPTFQNCKSKTYWLWGITAAYLLWSSACPRVYRASSPFPDGSHIAQIGLEPLEFPM